MYDDYKYYKIKVSARARVRCIRAKSFEDAVNIFREQPFAFIKADVYFAGVAKTIRDFNEDNFLVASSFVPASDDIFTPIEKQVNYSFVNRPNKPSKK